jgi:pimeloyl-ACP methyl ester carboxylesterase
MNKITLILSALAAAALTACSTVPETTDGAPLVIERQGSFAFGGTSILHPGTFSEKNFLSPNGQRAYGDHGYAFYQVPVHAKAYPIVFQHGGAQTKRTWESTPDGREGFQNIFLRKGYATYLVDQPRMGEAGLATKADDGKNPWAGNPLYGDKTLFILSRIGDAKGVFKDSQFPNDAKSVDAFQRSWTPYSGQLDNDLNAEALGILLKDTGPAILMTHSMGGTVGWRTPKYTDNVKAIVAMEPGGTEFLFPKGEAPHVVTAKFKPLSAAFKEVPPAEFEKLARIPMLLVYGDYIEPNSHVGSNKWNSEFHMAKEFVAAVNRHGGHAALIHLPEIGIKGNSHFLMAEKNNREIADLIDRWIAENVK